MAQYIGILKYYSGDLPMACTMYASSECYFGLNLRPLSDPSEYDMVTTTYAGLNLYRVSDVLRVTGFHNAAPQFQFVRRKNVLLSIESDKTDEAELQLALERASALLRPHGASVAEYTSQACTKSIPGHYVVYWELLSMGAGATAGDTAKEADSSVGLRETRVVRAGTFEELMDCAISRGASINQYKAPRCVTFPPIIELLDSRVCPATSAPRCGTETPARRSG
uniref:Uncharacterized protein n=1 Tax=Aegilops tauschii TaxID=37682 RepID=M8C8A1_AEGTA